MAHKGRMMPWPHAASSLIADEPVAALGVTVQAQTLHFILDLEDQFVC